MLWYKFWLETRWRFVIGLVLLIVIAGGTAFDWTATSKLLPLAGAIDTGTAIGRRLKEAAEIERDYRGFVWWQWFKQNLSQLGTLFAVLLGSGGVVSANADSGALFTLSLPISRTRLVGVRAATGLLELLAIIAASSLVIPLMAPGVGQRYPMTDLLVHVTCAFVATAAFFSFALLLSTAFDDLWRPLLMACALAAILAGCEFALADLSSYGLFHLMSGETYFRTGRVPWIAMLVGTAVSAGLLFTATSNLARRNF